MLATLSDIMRASLERRGQSVAAEVAELSSEALQTGNLFALEELIHTEKPTMTLWRISFCWTRTGV